MVSLTRYVASGGVVVMFSLTIFVHRVAAQASGDDNAGRQSIEDEASANADALDRDDLRRRPIDLNSATIEELVAAPTITRLRARRYVAWRDSMRAAHRTTNVAASPGIGGSRFALVAPFVTQTEVSTRVDVQSRLAYMPEPQSGFQTGAFDGSRPHTFERIDVWHGGLDVHAVAEKDAGERSMFDHTALSAVLREPNTAATVVGGDFSIGFGQGLLFWRTAASSKGGDVIRDPCRSSFGFMPVRSATEYGTFRGGAVSWGSTWSLGAFFTRTARDASVASDGTFATFQTSGLHRTSTELASENTVHERMAGARAGYRWEGGEIGAIAAATSLDHPWRVADTMFSRLKNASVTARIDHPLGEVFGEYAVDGRSGAAVIGGTAAADDALDCSVLYRRYPHTFHSLHTNAFGEHNDARNEEGLYIGMEWRPSADLVITGFHDMFSFPAPTAQLPMPSHGDESFLTATVRCANTLKLRALVGWKQSPLAVDHVSATGDVTQRVAEPWRRRERIEIVDDQPAFRLRGRVECVQYKKSDEHDLVVGALVLADATWRARPDITVAARVVMFATDNFDSRLYEYEEALEGTAALPALYGFGRRMYVYCVVELVDGVQLEAKWSETVKPQEPGFGSGVDATTGPVVHMIEAQLKWRIR